ncbi:hypothetical protein [Glutamicibacter sp.]|uniref:hypothetical protein n=1 Tax=Glutamicibacter sp. TaxID=1931995 RepID=UPI003D6B0794
MLLELGWRLAYTVRQGGVRGATRCRFLKFEHHLVLDRTSWAGARLIRHAAKGDRFFTHSIQSYVQVAGDGRAGLLDGTANFLLF